ncbi:MULTISPECIES: hypothetical protein [unclassified Nocardia]|uniref:hypothetical protein n=1 Tax=unclassified Nocardia TaxID=2637762 RepID=UPI001CE434B8|nr:MULTISPECIES: hypothetical protein [unclassified Nocardia]
MTETEIESNELTVTVHHVDPELVAVLRRAVELAAERSHHWLRGEHVLAALAEGPRGGQSLFDMWWPREGAEPDPNNGYHRAEPGAALRPVSLEELKTVTHQMMPPVWSGPTGDGPAIEYTASGPDREEYHALIEGPGADFKITPQYADYEPGPATSTE